MGEFSFWSRLITKITKQNACQGNDIPAKIIKENINIVTDIVYNNFNNLLLSPHFSLHWILSSWDHLFYLNYIVYL